MSDEWLWRDAGGRLTFDACRGPRAGGSESAAQGVVSVNERIVGLPRRYSCP